MKPVKIKTGPFPNFATDNMPMLMAVLTKVEGKSEIVETIFSNRYMAAGELARMGASISIKGNKAIIIGKKNLYGAECISSDLRTTFAIILGAIVARGKYTDQQFLGQGSVLFSAGSTSGITYFQKAIEEGYNGIWDVAPMIPLIKNAGGHISTWKGKDPRNGGNIIASSNLAIHKKILRLLKPLFK